MRINEQIDQGSKLNQLSKSTLGKGDGSTISSNGTLGATSVFESRAPEAKKLDERVIFDALKLSSDVSKPAPPPPRRRPNPERKENVNRRSWKSFMPPNFTEFAERMGASLSEVSEAGASNPSLRDKRDSSALLAEHAGQPNHSEPMCESLTLEHVSKSSGTTEATQFAADSYGSATDERQPLLPAGDSHARATELARARLLPSATWPRARKNFPKANLDDGRQETLEASESDCTVENVNLSPCLSEELLDAGLNILITTNLREKTESELRFEEDERWVMMEEWEEATLSERGKAVLVAEEKKSCCLADISEEREHFIAPGDGFAPSPGTAQPCSPQGGASSPIASSARCTEDVAVQCEAKDFAAGLEHSASPAIPELSDTDSVQMFLELEEQCLNEDEGDGPILVLLGAQFSPMDSEGLDPDLEKLTGAADEACEPTAPLEVSASDSAVVSDLEDFDVTCSSQVLSAMEPVTEPFSERDTLAITPTDSDGGTSPSPMAMVGADSSQHCLLALVEDASDPLADVGHEDCAVAVLMAAAVASPEMGLCPAFGLDGAAHPGASVRWEGDHQDLFIPSDGVPQCPEEPSPGPVSPSQLSPCQPPAPSMVSGGLESPLQYHEVTVEGTNPSHICHLLAGRTELASYSVPGLLSEDKATDLGNESDGSEGRTCPEDKHCHGSPLQLFHTGSASEPGSEAAVLPSAPAEEHLWDAVSSGQVLALEESLCTEGSPMEAAILQPGDLALLFACSWEERPCRAVGSGPATPEGLSTSPAALSAGLWGLGGLPALADPAVLGDLVVPEPWAQEAAPGAGGFTRDAEEPCSEHLRLDATAAAVPLVVEELLEAPPPFADVPVGSVPPLPETDPLLPGAGDFGSGPVLLLAAWQDAGDSAGVEQLLNNALTLEDEPIAEGAALDGAEGCTPGPAGSEPVPVGCLGPPAYAPCADGPPAPADGFVPDNEVFVAQALADGVSGTKIALCRGGGVGVKSQRAGLLTSTISFLSHPSLAQLFQKEQVDPLQLKLQQVNGVGQGLIQSAGKNCDVQGLEHDMEEINTRWNTLNKKVAQRIAQLQEALLRCGKFQDALEPLLSWLADTEELISNQKPPSAEYKVVKAQIQEQKLLQRLLDDRKATVEMIQAEGGRIAQSAEPADREKISGQLQSLESRWAALLCRAAGRQKQLEDILVLAKQFHETTEPVSDWLSVTEKKLANSEPIGTQTAKIQQQISRHKALEEDIEGHAADVAHAARVGQALSALSCAAEQRLLAEKLDSLQGRYGEVRERCCRKAALLEQALCNARLFGEEEVEVLNWLAEVEDKLGSVSVKDYKRDVLQKQHADQLALNEEIVNRKKNVDQAIRNGQALLKQTTGEEVLLIQEKLDGIKTRYSDITAASSKALRTLEQARQLATKFQSTHEELNAWMSKVEDELASSGGRSPASEQIPQFQQRQKELKKEVMEQRLVLDTVNEVSRALLELVPWRAREGLDKLVSDTNERYKLVSDTIRQRYEQAADAELAWVAETKRKLMALGAIRLEQDQTTAQLQVQKAFSIDIIRHKDSMDELFSQRNEIFGTCGEEQKAVLQEKTESLVQQYEAVSQLNSERYARLERAQVLVNQFWETYEELSPWIEETQGLISQLPPPAIDHEQLKQQQEDMRQLRESIAEHKPHIDKLLKIGPQLKDLNPEEGEMVQKKYSTAEAMYAKIKEEVCQRALALDEAVSQSTQVHLWGTGQPRPAADPKTLRRVRERQTPSGWFHSTVLLPVCMQLSTTSLTVPGWFSWERCTERRFPPAPNTAGTSPSASCTDAETNGICFGCHAAHLPSGVGQQSKCERYGVERLCQLWELVWLRCGWTLVWCSPGLFAANGAHAGTNRRLQVSLVTGGAGPAGSGQSSQSCRALVLVLGKPRPTEIDPSPPFPFLKSPRSQPRPEEGADPLLLCPQAEEFRTAVHMLLEWLSEAEQSLRFRGALPDDAEALQSLIDVHKEFMKKVEEKRVDVNAAVGMGEVILSACHPDCITTIKHWITIIRARFEEVLTWARQHQQRLEAALSELVANAELLEELLAWIQWAETTLIQRDQEPAPQNIDQVKALITEHQVSPVLEQTCFRALWADTCEGKRAPCPSQAVTWEPRKSLTQAAPPTMPIISQSETKNPRINQLSARWQQVWLLALERQRKLNDALDRLEELKEFANFDFDVWRKKYMRWMNHKKSRVMDFFRRIDKDQDGKITRQEFIDGILASKFPTTKLEMTAVADIFDRDGDGYIDYYEFVAALHPNKDAYRPTTDADKIEDEVTRQVAQCKCAKRFQVEQIGENKYRFFLGNQFGDSQQLRLVRILRSTVMVRVGGGWMALDEFLVKNDPCRARGRTNLELREKFILPEGASQGMTPFRSRGRRSKPSSRAASPTRSSSSASQSNHSCASMPSSPATPASGAKTPHHFSRCYDKPWLINSKAGTPLRGSDYPDLQLPSSEVTPAAGSKLKRPTFHSSRTSLVGDTSNSSSPVSSGAKSGRADPKKAASRPTSRAGSRAGSRASSRRGSDASDFDLLETQSACSDTSESSVAGSRRGAKPSKIPTMSKKTTTAAPKAPGPKR
uniref:MACF1 n=1 Tax=Pavo cristatus TaxID=9049 RepID=A0A8C9FYI7_PAVCR